MAMLPHRQGLRADRPHVDPVCACLSVTLNALREVVSKELKNNGKPSGLVSEDAASESGTVVDLLHPLGSEMGIAESQTKQSLTEEQN